MRMGPLSIASGDVSCSAVPFRYRKRLWLTVVVKASFAIVPGGRSIHVGAAELHSEERHLGGHPARSIEAASDLAPYLPRCDVTFVGHACAPGGRPAPAVSVRLGLARDGRPILDKVLHVFGDRGPGGPTPFERMPLVYELAIGGRGEPNPVGKPIPNLVDPADRWRPACFAPLSRLWPPRSSLLGDIDPHILEAPIAEIPDAIPWGYFQAAPPDQQLDYLRGDEWLVLDGLHPTAPRVQTCLPSARGAVRVLVRSMSAPAVGRAVDMVCDTLAIDGDRQRFTLAWRGCVDLPGGEAALPSLVVAAALQVQGRDVDWARLWTQGPLSPLSSARPVLATEADCLGTVTLGLIQQTIAPAQAGTASLGADMRDAVLSARLDVIPRGSAPLPPVPAPAGGPTPGQMSSVDDSGEGTIALLPDRQAMAGLREVAPFPIPPAGAPGPVAMVPGAPWSLPVAQVQPPLDSEGTLLPLDSGDSFSPRSPMSAPPPVVTPSPRGAPPSESPVSPPLVLPAPVAAPVPPPALVASQPTPPPALSPPTPGSPEALITKLRAAGASNSDIETLMRALKPPPPNDD
ncbi:DUF2169 family type VI secretion system accessory protein [Sorangium sp. So ce117]|uniref:DUF2169 family type VI secretion system accessory protein n=1 Tax=Sorangium sp. So ce117 TaxID=3133277 RepID=UPI003F5F0E30